MDALHEIHAWEGVLVYTIYLPDFQGIVCKPLCREINARLCKYIFTAAQLNNFTFYTASLHNKKTRTKALDLMKKTFWKTDRSGDTQLRSWFRGAMHARNSSRTKLVLSFRFLYCS